MKPQDDDSHKNTTEEFKVAFDVGGLKQEGSDDYGNESKNSLYMSREELHPNEQEQEQSLDVPEMLLKKGVKK